MRKRLRKHTISVRHALDGINYALNSQPNYQIHLLLATLAILAGIYFRISYIEWLVILLLITMGLVIETINTALEATCDAIDLEKREDIRIAKDLAAGAMLFFAIGACILASIILLPKIL